MLLRQFVVFFDGKTDYLKNLLYLCIVNSQLCLNQ